MKTEIKPLETNHMQSIINLLLSKAPEEIAEIMITSSGSYRDNRGVAHTRVMSNDFGGVHSVLKIFDPKWDMKSSVEMTRLDVCHSPDKMAVVVKIVIPIDNRSFKYITMLDLIVNRMDINKSPSSDSYRWMVKVLGELDKERPDIHSRLILEYGRELDLIKLNHVL